MKQHPDDLIGQTLSHSTSEKLIGHKKRHSMSNQASALKEAAWVFALSRFVIFLFTYIGMSTTPDQGTSTILNCFQIQDQKQCITAWMHFDVFSYTYVAMYGYTNVKATAFFPLYPLLLRIPGALLGGSVVDYYIAGIVISNLCFYAALVVLYLLVSDLFDTSTATLALFYCTFAPYALFFFIGYTEALFLLLFLSTFFFFKQAQQKKGIGNWWLAGFCGFLAALCHSQGMLLVLPYMIVYADCYLRPSRFHLADWKKKFLALFPLILIPLGVGVYMLYLWRTQGNPLLMSTSEEVYWGRTRTFPLVTISYVVKALVTPSPLQVQNVLNLFGLLVPLTLLVAGWRRIPFHYAIFALSLIIFATVFPQGTMNALAAAPRYVLVDFPVLVICATWKQPQLKIAYQVITLSFFIFNLLQFTHHYWVA